MDKEALGVQRLLAWLFAPFMCCCGACYCVGRGRHGPTLCRLTYSCSSSDNRGVMMP